MSASTGIAAIGDYTTPATLALKIAALLALIPNPDSTGSSGATGGGGGTNTYLDEMNPAAATQLRVELAAFTAAVAAAQATGQHVVTAGEAAANQADIVTGLADITLANCAVTVRRAGTNVTADAVISEPVAGTIRVADGGVTYNVTAGDVITWFAAP